MGMCKGNLGNLLQHWVLCETLDLLMKSRFDHLHLTCTHSMAPWSVLEPVDYSSKHSPRVHRRRYFDKVRNRSNQSQASIYEECWSRCSVQQGVPYPSSAVFAFNFWRTKLSLSLCEADERTASEIDGWLRQMEIAERLSVGALYRGDWRDQLAALNMQNILADVHVIELDPMQFDKRNPGNEQVRNGAILYPDDMGRIVEAVKNVKRPIVLQLTSYDVNNNNSLELTVPAMLAPLTAADFVLSARVSPNAQMVSLVLTRGLTLWDTPESLGQQFNRWLQG